MGRKHAVMSENDLTGHEKEGTHPHQAVSGFKLLLCLLTVINQREASAPTTTKECLEPERNDACLVDLVDLAELLGQFGSGDWGAGRVEDIDDELTAGKEAVCGEFPGADCNRGRVILEGEKESEHRTRTASSRYGGIHPARSTRFSPTIQHASPFLRLL